jgi:steroid delta-isomerase-like uncharacterized protein
MTEADTDDRIELPLETFNDYAFDEHMEQFAEGATFVDPVLEAPVSGDEHRAYLEDAVDAFPDVHQEVDAVHDAGAVTVLESRFTGTHRGELEGVPPTGNAVEVPLASVIRCSEEGITHWRDYWNEQTFREQLGLAGAGLVTKLPGFALWKLRNAV